MNREGKGIPRKFIYGESTSHSKFWGRKRILGGGEGGCCGKKGGMGGGGLEEEGDRLVECAKIRAPA